MVASGIGERNGLPIGRTVDIRPARTPQRRTVLEGRHVRLAPIDPASHGEDLWHGSHGREAEALWRYLSVGPFARRADFQAYLEAAASRADPFMFAILDRASGRTVGHASLLRIEPAHRVVEVGNILFTPALQRGASGTEAMYLLARHAFEELGFRRYEWKCNALNAPSRRAAERYGFTFEGLFRDHMIVKGLSRDTAWFAMLEAEWPSRRTAFERWLDPAHFDGAGRQRLSLSALNARSVPGHALRRAGPDDVPAFAALQEAAYAPNRPLLGVEPVPLLTDPHDALARYETWLCEEEGRLIGALALDPRPDHLVIWSVSVQPGLQGRGLGRELLAAAEARTRALGLSTLRLWTGAPLAKNIDWYGRRGYAVERTEDLPDRRLVHMVKHI